MKRIVGLSGGKDSSVMALRLKEVEPNHDYIFGITPTGRELPAMTEHWKRLECLLGCSLLRIPAPSLLDLIVQQKALPNWRMRWCTRMVKIEPFMSFAASHAPAVCCIGIRADEVIGDSAREGTDWSGVEGITQDFPLVRWGWGINRVKEYLREKSVVVPERTDCDICFFQRLAEWWRLWKFHLDKWMEGEAMESLTGHTFRSDQRDSWPASMEGLRKMFEKGFVPKGANQLDMPLDISERSTMCAWCAR